MAVELATAYVSLTVTAKGIASDINRELGGPLQSAAESAGQKSGAGFKGGFGGALQSLKADVAGAEGLFGKLGAAGSSAGSMLQANAGAAAAAAGTAFVAFAAKSVAAFQETALEAGKFAAATGVTVEQASRLREVASDYGISADAIQGTLLRFNKSAEDAAPALKALGAELVRTKDGNVDSYESFLAAATAIGKIADPTKRAQAAQEVFGRSYSQIAELMEMDAGELRKALDGVSDAKVIDQAELDQAREFRNAIANLKDIGEDLMVTFGQGLVPILTDVANALVSVNDVAKKVLGDEGLGKLLKFAFDLSGLGQLVNLVNKLDAAFTPELNGLIADNAFQTTEFGDAASDAAGQGSTLSNILGGFENTASGYRSAINKAKVATEEMDTAYRTLMGHLDESSAWNTAQESMATLLETMADSEASWLDLSNASIQATKDAAGWLQVTDDIPDEVKTSLYTVLDQGGLDAYNTFVAVAKQGFTVPVQLRVPNVSATTKGLGGGILVEQSAVGRYVPANTNLLTTVAEPGAGDEVILPLQNGSRMRSLLADPRVSEPILAGMRFSIGEAAQPQAPGSVTLVNQGRPVTVDEMARAIRMARLAS